MSMKIAEYIKKDILDGTLRLPGHDLNVRRANLSGEAKESTLLQAAMGQVGLMSHILRAVDEKNYHNILQKFSTRTQEIINKYGSNKELEELQMKIQEQSNAPLEAKTKKLQDQLMGATEAEKAALTKEVNNFTNVIEALYNQDEKIITDIISKKIAQRYDPKSTVNFKQLLKGIQELWSPDKNYQGAIGEYINTGNVIARVEEPIRDFLKDIVNLHKKQDEKQLISKLQPIILQSSNKLAVHYISRDNPDIIQKSLHSLDNKQLLEVNAIYRDNKLVRTELENRTSIIKNLFNSIINLDTKYLKEAFALKNELRNKKEIQNKLPVQDLAKMAEIVTNLDKSMHKANDKTEVKIERYKKQNIQVKEQQR